MCVFLNVPINFCKNRDIFISGQKKIIKISNIHILKQVFLTNFAQLDPDVPFFFFRTIHFETRAICFADLLDDVKSQKFAFKLRSIFLIPVAKLNIREFFQRAVLFIQPRPPVFCVFPVLVFFFATLHHEKRILLQNHNKSCHFVYVHILKSAYQFF